MKNILKIALVMLMLSAVSYAKDVAADQGLYVGAGLGIMATNKNADAGLGLSLRGGFELDNVLKGLGIQVELNKSLSDPEASNGKDVDVMTLATYAAFDIPIPNSKVTLRPRIGVILPNLQDDIDSRDFILSSGFAVTYTVQNNLRLYADYTVLGEGISNYSAGVEIKF